MAKDDLRKHALSGAPKKRVVAVDGVDYEVRVPTMAQRSTIRGAAGLRAGAAPPFNADVRLGIAAVITCTYVPGTEDHVFDEADTDAMLAAPAGGVVDQLARVAVGMMTSEAEDAAKNSDATPTDKSSS